MTRLQTEKFVDLVHSLTQGDMPSHLQYILVPSRKHEGNYLDVEVRDVDHLGGPWKKVARIRGFGMTEANAAILAMKLKLGIFR